MTTNFPPIHAKKHSHGKKDRNQPFPSTAGAPSEAINRVAPFGVWPEAPDFPQKSTVSLECALQAASAVDQEHSSRDHSLPEQVRSAIASCQIKNVKMISEHMARTAHHWRARCTAKVRPTIETTWRCAHGAIGIPQCTTHYVGRSRVRATDGAEACISSYLKETHIRNGASGINQSHISTTSCAHEDGKQQRQKEARMLHHCHQHVSCLSVVLKKKAFNL